MTRKTKINERTEAAVALRDQFTRVGPGKIAAVITHLEMRAQPQLLPEQQTQVFALRRVPKPDPDWYRDLYRRVGEDWLWFSRLALGDAALRGLIHDPAVEVYALRHRGRDEGLLELDLRRFPDIEISFLGVVTTLLGKGAGRYLINRAIEIAWARGPNRVTVHTCTFDHPRALEFYLHSGFTPYARSVEIADDPRLRGLLPRSVAPHIPTLKDD
ncbi:MAG: GNAT family N-acetyltransferase [Xanthobacteraceae bacterium]|nr:GNAT family N-acetyltransferase [Xanthobacteraceae bacterium]